MKVLIATDGSEHSDAAIHEYFKSMYSVGDEVKIVSVVEPATHLIGAPFGVVDDYYERYIEDSRQIAAEHLQKAKSKVISLVADVNMSAEILIGAPGKSIVDEAGAWGADLIVVGSHGRGFWERVYLGSVSNSVVHQSTCSVLIVRP